MRQIFDKNTVSGGALEYLRKFITENLCLESTELTTYRMARSKSLRRAKSANHKKNKKEPKILSEFEKLERRIYKKFLIEERELQNSSLFLQKELKMLRDKYDLTPTEQKVLELLKQGYSYGECAKELAMSEGTMRTHIVNIFQKKGVHSLQELIVLELTGKLKEPATKTQTSASDDALNLLKNLI